MFFSLPLKGSAAGVHCVCMDGSKEVRVAVGQEVRDNIKELRRSEVLELSSGANPCGGRSLRLTAFNCNSM